MLEMRVELGYRDNNFLKPAHFPTGITPPPLLHASSLELFSPPVLSPPPTKQPRLTAPGGSYLSQGCCREPGLMIPLYHCNQSEASAGMLKNNDSVVTAFASSARRSVSEEHLFFREKCNRTSHSNAWCRSSSSLQVGEYSLLFVYEKVHLLRSTDCSQIITFIFEVYCHDSWFTLVLLLYNAEGSGCTRLCASFFITMCCDVRSFNMFNCEMVDWSVQPTLPIMLLELYIKFIICIPIWKLRWMSYIDMTMTL